MPQKQIPKRFEPRAHKLYRILDVIQKFVKRSPTFSLDDEFLERASIRHQKWSRYEEDPFFRCMTKEEFTTLTPPDPTEPAERYENVEPPRFAAPKDVTDREKCSYLIEIWFDELRCRKVAFDGSGFSWPGNEDGAFWVPRDLYEFEKHLYNGYRVEPSVPYHVHSAFMYTSKELLPHRMHHVLIADEGIDGVLSQSEVDVFLSVMKSRIKQPAFRDQAAPVRDLRLQIKLSFPANTPTGTHSFNP